MSSAKEQAQKLFTEYTDTVERIRGNKAASREGKRADLARTYLNARQRMEDIFAAEAAQHARQRRQLEARLFGSGDLVGDAASMTISRRDAGDRVARITKTGEALDLLHRALSSGDEVLARAVAQWAYQNRNVDVANAYLEARPQHDAAFNELWVLPSGERNPIEEARRHISFPIQKPGELDDVADMHLQSVADGRELAQTA
jgi:hypothetical protein